MHAATLRRCTSSFDWHTDQGSTCDLSVEGPSTVDLTANDGDYDNYALVPSPPPPLLYARVHRDPAVKSPQGSVPKWPKSSLVLPTLQWPQAVMADADEPHAPRPTSDSTSGGLHPLTAGLLARHDRRCAPTATALSKRPADWPAAEQERAAVRIRGAAPRMANLEPVEKTAVVSDSFGADAAPAIRARPTRSSSAQLALEPTALLNRLETMLLGNHPVPTPSNEVSIVGEVTNGIIIAAKAAVNTLFLSQRRGG